MRGIFTYDKRNNKIVLHPDSIALCPVLSELEEDELKYIIYVYDYINSPYARKPIEERKEIALKIVFDNKDAKIETKKKVRDAIDAYQSLIYDPKNYVVDIYTSKIAQINKAIMIEKDVKDITDMDKAISILQKRIDEYQDDILRDEEKALLKGDKKLSMLEKMKRNRKLYELDKPNAA